VADVTQDAKKTRARPVPGRRRANAYRKSVEAQIESTNPGHYDPQSPWTKFAENEHIRTYTLLVALLAIEARLEQIAHYLANGGRS